MQSRKHTVGFMGDGINDASALRTADVGISVDTAVDIAKESADFILLEKSLLVLEAGVVEGRKVFANILKYVRMGPLYRVHRPLLVDLRLHHILYDALRLWMQGRFDARGSGSQRKSVSDRLVRRESADADSDHPHHSDQQDSLPAKPCLLAIGSYVWHCCGDWHRLAIHVTWSLPRFHSTAVALLAAVGSHRSGIRALDPFGEDLASAKKSDLIALHDLACRRTGT